MGYRHIKDVPEVIPQQELIFKREPENSQDSLAVAVYNSKNEKLGYVPACLTGFFSDLETGKILLTDSEYPQALLIS